MRPTPPRLTPPARPHVVLVHKRSMYEWYAADDADENLHQLFASGDVSVRNVRAAHDRHSRSLEASVEAWQRANSVSLEVMGRERLDTLGGPLIADLVVVVGGDGTVLEVSHALQGSPALGMNSDPETSIGYLCAGNAADMQAFVQEFLDGALNMRPLQRLQVAINQARVGPAVLNDALFAHTCPAATSRYILNHQGAQESQKSSGLWISTAAGSTAAIRSAGGQMMDWSDTRLQFLVRELYARPGEAPTLTSGWLSPSERLQIISRMQQAALYLDGPHICFPVTIGDRVEVSCADHPLWHVHSPQSPPR
jgi:NAD+ kinase